MSLKIIAGVSFAALMLTSVAHAEDMKYVQNSAGEAVKNSVEQTCVQAQFGSEPEGCATAPEKQEKPPVVPKVKAKGNYKGAVQMDPATKATMKGYQK
jgi:OOP family OmpA-OmpF porin